MVDVQINKNGHPKRIAATVKKSMAAGYKLGTLAEARKAFVEVTKLSVQWEESEVD